MFWKSGPAQASIPEVSTIQECDALLSADLIILFKHSTTCAISLRARREVARFSAAHPDTPVHLISVRQHREIARYIAERTGIEHESPQILVLRRGEVTGVASHGAITAGLLRSLL